MIQRIQSIYLLIAAIIPIILLFIPIGTLENSMGFYTYSSFNVKIINTDLAIIGTSYNALLLIVSSILSFATILFYKKRKLQVRIINFNMLAILGALLCMFYLYPQIIFPKNPVLAGTILDFNFAMLIALFSALGLFFAKKAILKDEALVKSTERLR